MKVFLTRDIPDNGLSMLRQENIDYEIWQKDRNLLPSELLDACRNMDGVVNVGHNRYDASFFLSTAPRLRALSLYSAGYDLVDLEAATKYGVPVGNTPGVVSKATAEIAFFLMQAVARKAFFHNDRLLRGNWKHFDSVLGLGISLEGKTLGIFGLGLIGYEMARMCKAAFHMKVIYCNRHVNERAELELGAKRVDFNSLLKHSDVISLHCSLNPDTFHVFDETAFLHINPGTILINTARGAVVDQTALTAALIEKRIWGAGLDVMDPEPIEPDDKLLHLPNVVLLPHIGSATEDTRARMAEIAIGNLIAGLKGQKMKFQLNEVSSDRSAAK